MKTIAVCLIVRDEEQVLARILGAAALFADEIIVLDTGSADRSAGIAREFTPKVFSMEWCDDFACARNTAASYASSDYVMWLDADDVIEKEDIGRLIELKKMDFYNKDILFLLYTSVCKDSDLWSGSGCLRDRICRREYACSWVYPIHEVIEYPAHASSIDCTEIRIFHDKVHENEPGRNLRIFDKKIAEGFVMNEFNKGYYVRELAGADRPDEACELYMTLTDPYVLYYALPFYLWSVGRLLQSRDRQELQTACQKKLQKLREDIGPKELVYAALGAALIDLGRMDEAEGYLLEAAGKDLDYSDHCVHYPAYADFVPWTMLCRLYLERGEFPRAYNCHLKAKKSRPGNPQVFFYDLYFREADEQLFKKEEEFL